MENSIVKDNVVYKIAMTGLMTSLIVVSAFIKIPTPFVPLTMQIFVILLAPMLVGLKISFSSVLLYIVIGLAGFPVFSNGGGPGYVFSPTFGFTIGFLLSTIPNALITGKTRKFYIMFFGGLISLVCIYAVGVTYLWYNLNFLQGKTVAFIYAIKIGALPFIIPDIIKLVAAIVVARKIKPLIINKL